MLFFFWVNQVNPLPEAGAFRQFYIPFQNYLHASLEFPNHFKFLTEQVILDDIPSGGFLLAWGISLFGCQSLFLNAPYLMAIFLLAPLVMLAGFYRLSPIQAIGMVSLLFFFPPTQILLKGFSPEGYCVVYTLLGVYFLRSFLAKGGNLHLAGSSISFWFSMSAHPLGFFFFLNVFLAYGLHSLFREKFCKKAVILMVLALLSALPFYYLESFSRMLDLFSGERAWAPTLLVLLFTLIPLLLRFFLKFLPIQGWNSFLPRFFSGFWIAGVLILFSLFFIGGERENPGGFAGDPLLLLAGYTALAWCLFRYSFHSIRAFVYLLSLLSFLNGLLFYMSLSEQTPYMLFFPLFLVLIQSFQESKGFVLNAFVLVLCILCSSFFPSLSSLEKSLGSTGSNLVLHGFRNLHTNPLSWKRCEASSIQREIKEILSKRKFDTREGFSVFEHLHHDSRLLFDPPMDFSKPLPEFSRLDDLPQEKLKEYLDLYAKRGRGLFEIWLSSGKAAYIIRGLRPWEERLGPPAALEDLLEDEERTGEIGISLSHAYFQFLKESANLEKYYDFYPIPKKAPRILLYVKKSVPTAEPDNRKLNRALSRLSLHLPVNFLSRDVPSWFPRLEKSISKALKQKEAKRIHQLGLHYYQRADYYRAYTYFQRAYELDESNPSMRNDLKNLKERLPKAMWDFFLE